MEEKPPGASPKSEPIHPNGPGLNYGEAFCIMQYRCRVCHKGEDLWNSRDGVTPFSIPCRNAACNLVSNQLGCPMVHINFKGDVFAPDHVPARGDRIFISTTRPLAKIYAKIRLNHMMSQGYTPSRPIKESLQAIEDDLYHDGAGPHLLIV